MCIIGREYETPGLVCNHEVKKKKSYSSVLTFTTFLCRGGGLRSSTQPPASASFRASNFLPTSST